MLLSRTVGLRAGDARVLKTSKHSVIGSDTVVSHNSQRSVTNGYQMAWSPLTISLYDTSYHRQYTAADAVSRSPIFGAANIMEIDNEASLEPNCKVQPVIPNQHYDEYGYLINTTLWHNGHLCQDDCIVLPVSTIEAVLYQYHEYLVPGYWGIHRTVD